MWHFTRNSTGEVRLPDFWSSINRMKWVVNGKHPSSHCGCICLNLVMVWTHFVFTQSEVSHEPCGGQWFRQRLHRFHEESFAVEILRRRPPKQDLPHRHAPLCAAAKKTGDQFSLVMCGSSNIWMFPKIVVPPKSSILIGFSIINHPFWGTPILGNIHMIFDLVTRPERRHASIMNGSGTESLADAAGCLMWSLKIPTCMRISFFFKRWPNGIGDMTLFHIFCEQNCQLRIWRFSFTHSVFWNETVYNHLCVLKQKSEINMNPNNPFTKSLIYSIYDLHVHPPKKRLSFFFSSNRFFFFWGENTKTRQSRHETPGISLKKKLQQIGVVFWVDLLWLLFPKGRCDDWCLGPLKETQETHMKWASLS